MTLTALAEQILAKAAGQEGRVLIALAGPPGAGKSTLSSRLAKLLGQGTRVVPMDGFHLDDAILEARGLRSRKGAPETFDLAGFLHLLGRLRQEAEVAIPVFDRRLELSRAAGDIVMPSDKILLVEGNYLLFDEGEWRRLAGQFDLTVWLDVPEEELVSRLHRRWAHYGKTRAEAQAWIEGNDLPNIRRCVLGSRPADISISLELVTA